jgi:hypothetical protein
VSVEDLAVPIGRTITGPWVPDPGQPRHAGSAYTATVRRID